MFSSIIKKIVGSSNERYLKKLRPRVARIGELEPQMRALADEDFPAKIAAWRGEVENGRSLDDLLPECFALVREAGRRKLGMRHFDVQLVGGIVLHDGRIAEMKTGEGKTLVATLPIVLNALEGKGVHLVTVNDYLARRDAEWMGKIYTFLGFSVGVIVNGLSDEERQAAYGSDITYGTNNEFGFDYLRDNMKFYKESLVQRGLRYAIVDEVDSILIDEARTPLIISGAAEEDTSLYGRVDSIIPRLKRGEKPKDDKDENAQPTGDFVVDEKGRTVSLTEAGVSKCERLLGIDNLYDPANVTYQHHVLQSLKAHQLYHKDVEYIVKDGEVVIVDEFTGRLMPGRRFSDGLHQALEAKEGVKVEAENQTLASITFQNFFRMYDKLAGMTGTADTEAVEFKEIYKLDVTVIPTNRPMIRKDFPDMIYKTQGEKFSAIAGEIADCYKRGQPVLVGTVSIEKSERVSAMLDKLGVPHSVLNAKQHELEAQIVAEAGQKGKVTIATNMAGRGTDIVLGDGVKELGGLHILGTERHESRRIDNQLRGRSGRQGDPGSSRFYLALDDDLMRLFGSDRIKKLMNTLGLKDGEAIENRMVTKAIESSQKRVEGHNFDIRKQLLDFDNVMNQQREVIYARRREVMFAEKLDDIVDEYIGTILDNVYAPEAEAKGRPLDDETEGLMSSRLDEVFDLSRFPDFAKGLPRREQAEAWIHAILGKLQEASPDHYQEILRYFILETLDRNWKDHLLSMDYLRDGIGLRGYGQRDPKEEYKREGFNLFRELIYTIAEKSMGLICRLRIQKEVKEEEFQHKDPTADLQYQGSEDAGEAKPKKKKKSQPIRRSHPKVGRNDPCPCGSGKKYKNCCGRNK